MARELVNRIQQLRKNKGYEVTDHIGVRIQPMAEIERAINEYKDYICAEILADKFVSETGLNGDFETIEIENIHILVSIEKL